MMPMKRSRHNEIMNIKAYVKYKSISILVQKLCPRLKFLKRVKVQGLRSSVYSPGG